MNFKMHLTRIITSVCCAITVFSSGAGIAFATDLLKTEDSKINFIMKAGVYTYAFTKNTWRETPKSIEKQLGIPSEILNDATFDDPTPGSKAGSDTSEKETTYLYYSKKHGDTLKFVFSDNKLIRISFTPALNLSAQSPRSALGSFNAQFDQLTKFFGKSDDARYGYLSQPLDMFELIDTKRSTNNTRTLDSILLQDIYFIARWYTDKTTATVDLYPLKTEGIAVSVITFEERNYFETTTASKIN